MKKYDETIFQLDALQKWSYIPTEWRPFWVDKMKEIDASISLTNPKPRFFVRTAEHEELNDAIHNLEWISLSKAIDKHLQYPSVRCPFGCSEFLHLCNRVPLEDFLCNVSNGCFECTSDANTKPNWARGIRPDFPKECTILENQNFVCLPSLILDENEGVRILTCRHHSTKEKKLYIHPPDSPTGSLYTHNSNQYAQAVLRSRTLRKAKLNACSDTYETVVFQGGYDGVDSVYLSTFGRYNVDDNLADLRDCLSIAGRDDIRQHVLELSRNPSARNYLPKYNVQEKVSRALRMHNNLNSKFSSELACSTFIDLEDAVCLQEGTHNDTGKTIRLFQTVPPSPEDKGREVFYMPKWPSKFVKVHPHDSHGCKFVSITEDTGSFVVWCMLGSIMCVPELWSSLEQSITNNTSWNGWALTIAWESQQGFDSTTYGFKTKPFKIKEANEKHLRKILGINEKTKHTDADQFRKWWRSFPNIKIFSGELYKHAIPKSSNIVIVTRWSSSAWLPFEEDDEWQLRFFTIKNDSQQQPNGQGKLFARHGKTMFAGWWMQNSKTSGFQKLKSLPLDQISNFFICIYVRKHNTKVEELKKRYFSCLGGQCCVECYIHKVPLITIPTSKKKKIRNKKASCVCCVVNMKNKNKAWTKNNKRCEEPKNMVCPRVGCQIGICYNHYTDFTENNEDTTYEIDKKSCRIATSNNDNEQSTDLLQVEEELCGDDEDSNINPETYDFVLGPSEVHESPDMLYEDFDSMSCDEVDETFLHTPAFAEEHAEIELQAHEEVAFCPLHVLLNKQGHLLVRHNSKLRMTKKHAHFFQRIHSTCKGTCLPLVYAEALLFPDTFFYCTNDGSILGALPTALWADATTLKKINVASVDQHIRTRCFNPMLLCSTDPRYHFHCFDCKANIGLRGEDSRIVMQRGLAEKQKNEGVAFRQSSGNSELHGDKSEDHSNVHKLSALAGESMPDFFITQSCNQTTCKGLRVLRQWITSHEAIKVVMNKYQIDYQQAKRSL